MASWCNIASASFQQLRPIAFHIILVGYAQMAYHVAIQGSLLIMKCSGSDPLQREDDLTTTMERQRQILEDRHQQERQQAAREQAARERAEAARAARERNRHLNDDDVFDGSGNS